MDAWEEFQEVGFEYHNYLILSLSTAATLCNINWLDYEQLKVNDQESQNNGASAGCTSTFPVGSEGMYMKFCTIISTRFYLQKRSMSTDKDLYTPIISTALLRASFPVHCKEEDHL